MTEVLRTRAELASALASRRGTLAVVMTMGALHAGHEALLRAARERADDVIATIFVNPLQFGPNEDFDRYPRTFEADLEVCAAAGVRYVFAPSREEMYPDGEPMVRVDPGSLGEKLEGASRPGFFTGVLTVVLKLLNLIRPDVAFFGEKDYQQLTLVRRMVRDLELDVEIVGAGTPGGCAARLDYLVLTDPELGPPPATGPARMLVAAWVGTTRLIDNTPVELAPVTPEG